MTEQYPLLYSFRRCPYAMRARMALVSAGVQCDVIEVDFKDKPDHLLEISPKGTVPVLQTIDGQVIEESLDVMRWALSNSDPEGWLDCDLDDAFDLINYNDGDFKKALDRYKYPNRYPDEDCSGARNMGEVFLTQLNERLNAHNYLMGDNLTITDVAIFPFIRQFANTDREWFDALDLKPLQGWLQQRLESELFQKIVKKQKEDRYLLINI